MKKLVSVLMLGMMVFLAACSPAPAATSTAPAAVATQPSAGAAASVEISFSAWGAPEELAVWKQIIADFEAANPQIKVNIEVADWDSYWGKLKTLLAANTPPDLFAMDAPLFLDYQSRGVLLNLQPYLDKNPDMLKGIYPQTLQAYKIADGYYGLPRDFQTIVLFYNKDMFDAAKVAYPTADWTWEDLRAAAKKLTTTVNDKQQFGFFFDEWDMEPGWSEALWAYGGDIVSADHTKTLVGTPESRKAWQLLHDMVFVDKSTPDANTVSQYGSDLFQAGIAAMTPIGHWAVPGYNTSGFKYDVAPMPKGPAGQATSVNSAGFVVAKASKHPDEAFKFIQYVLSEKGQSRLADLGFACPVLKAVAESPTFLQQKGSNLNQKVFLDALAYAHMKPVFKGYDEWASTVGDGMGAVWRGEAELNPTLEQIVKDADAVLAKNQ
ncbi:MAG TPA: sugar ABC transporter substrate-binding protein [Anaerolineaceae bacterium]|nr:sugar ABC transporter substrate-binding protein [Anaerolineaceae bacterium]